ncbi:MAG TPA: serine/threonine-protein kinase [Nocardioidaceae bacterium]|nr:serine/threonine-protein kinase [Nocardioidaceae bacterium]
MSRELIGGRYLMRRPVGQGGMGTVWLCTDQTLHRDVAVKRMGSLPGETTAGAARAMREARLAAAMNHRNAVGVYDIVEHDDASWLVMEYFPSRNLGEIIDEDGPLTPRRAGAIGSQVASALAAAHKLGIVHRDVKPGNILVGDGDDAKVSDFGIARAEVDATLTQTGMMTGTPAYLPPEIATGGGASPASDVWALGATIYAAVEGEPPFGTHGNPVQLLSRVVQEPVPRPDHAGPLLPLLGEMLAKDPRSRPTMAEAATRLEHLPDSTQVAPLPPPAVPPSVPPVIPSDATSDRRRWAPVVIGLIVVLLLVVGGWALLRGDGGQDAPTASGPRDSTQGPADNEPADTKPTQSQPTDPESSDTSPTPDPTTPPANGGPAGFVRDYYALMPGDTDAGWSMLGGSLKTQGKASYEDFWSGIDDVEVGNVTVESPTTVVYEITYVQSDGTSQETKRITLEPRGDSYRIVDDDPA